jgi:hypothetical protein
MLGLEMYVYNIMYINIMYVFWRKKLMENLFLSKVLLL